jgi:hypothetical protein
MATVRRIALFLTISGAGRLANAAMTDAYTLRQIVVEGGGAANPALFHMWHK